jgi:hypothetical protein
MAQFTTARTALWSPPGVVAGALGGVADGGPGAAQLFFVTVTSLAVMGARSNPQSDRRWRGAKEWFWYHLETYV